MLINDFNLNYCNYSTSITYSAGSLAYDNTIKSGPGKLAGFFISSCSGLNPQMKFWDSITASGTVLLDTFSVGTTSIGTMYPFPQPVGFLTGLTIRSTGSLVATVFYY